MIGDVRMKQVCPKVIDGRVKGSEEAFLVVACHTVNEEREVLNETAGVGLVLDRLYQAAQEVIVEQRE